MSTEKKPRNYLKITEKDKKQIVTQQTKYPQKVTGKLTFETSDGKKFIVEHSCKTELKIPAQNEDKLEMHQIFNTISIARSKRNPKTWLIFDSNRGYLCVIQKHDLKHALPVFLGILKAVKKEKRSKLTTYV